MMSKNDLTPGDKGAIRKSKEPTVVTAASAKAESTEEATVYVDDFGRLCRNDAVRRFTSSAIFGFIMRRMSLSHELLWDNLHR